MSSEGITIFSPIFTKKARVIRVSCFRQHVPVIGEVTDTSFFFFEAEDGDNDSEEDFKVDNGSMMLPREPADSINGVSLSVPPLSIVAFRSLLDNIYGSPLSPFNLTRLILGVGGLDVVVADNGELDLEVGDLSLFFFFFLRIGDAGELMVFIAGRGGRLLLLSSILSFLCLR